MNEQSQIEDMRAAVRGDRERAEQARQRSLENVRALTGRVEEPREAPAGATAPRRRRPWRLFKRR